MGRAVNLLWGLLRVSAHRRYSKSPLESKGSGAVWSRPDMEPRTESPAAVSHFAACSAQRVSQALLVAAGARKHAD